MIVLAEQCEKQEEKKWRLMRAKKLVSRLNFVLKRERSPIIHHKFLDQRELCAD